MSDKLNQQDQLRKAAEAKDPYAAGVAVGDAGVNTDLQQAEEGLYRFFDVTPDLACIASTNGHFLKINSLWQQTLGYTDQEILSTPFLDMIHPDDRDATVKEVEMLLTGKETLQFINRYRCKDGSYRWLEWKASPAVDNKLLFAAARDITERKQAETIIAKQLIELQGWYGIMMKREMRNDELKHEVNEVLREAGQPIRYPNAGLGKITV